MMTLRDADGCNAGDPCHTPDATSRSAIRTGRRLGTAALLTLTLAVPGLSACSTTDTSSSPAAATGSTGSPAGDPDSAPSTQPGDSPDSEQPGTDGDSSRPGGTNPDGLEPVPSRTQKTKPPVPMGGTARFNPGVTVRVVRSVPVRLEGQGRGEVEGPGVRLDLVISNRTDETLDLSLVNATMTYGPNDTPARPGPAAMERPFQGRLDPGGRQRASYVFGVPAGQRDDVRLLVSYTADQPVAVLTGPVG